MRHYLLPNCLVLAAAVIGTRRAYDFAMSALPAARQYEANQISPEEPATKKAVEATTPTAKIKTKKTR